MAKKKAARRNVKVTVRRVVRKKGAAKTTRAMPKRTASRRAAPKRAVRSTAGRTRPKGLNLGRARVSGSAELDQYFLKDYEARQVFAFLGVKTLKELEEHSPSEIIDRLTAPMVQTVNRIRKALAMQNRCLAGDQKFAYEFKQQMLQVTSR